MRNPLKNLSIKKAQTTEELELPDNGTDAIATQQTTDDADATVTQQPTVEDKQELAPDTTEPDYTGVRDTTCFWSLDKKLR